MSKKHKSKHQSKAQQTAIIIAERYDRKSVAEWCYQLAQIFTDYALANNDEWWLEEAEVAQAWGMWIPTAPVKAFNQVCDQWSAWVAQQTYNASIKQGELL